MSLSPVAQENSISCSQSIVNFHNEGILKLSASAPFITRLHITDEGDDVDSTVIKVLKVFALAIAAIPLCIYHFAYTLVSKIIDCCNKSKAGNDDEISKQEARLAAESAAANRAALIALPTGAVRTEEEKKVDELTPTRPEGTTSARSNRHALNALPVGAASPAVSPLPAVTGNGSGRVVPRTPVDTSSVLGAGLVPTAQPRARRSQDGPPASMDAAPRGAAAASPPRTGDLFTRTPGGQHFANPAFTENPELEAKRLAALEWGQQSAATSPLPTQSGTTTASESVSLRHVNSSGSVDEEVNFHAESQVSAAGTGTLLASYAASSTEHQNV